jgi:hypothetical protein
VAEVLAGRAPGDDVDGFDGRPVDLRDVAEVDGVGPVVRHDGGGAALDLGIPDELDLDAGVVGCDLREGQFDTAHPSEEGTYPDLATAHPALLMSAAHTSAVSATSSTGTAQEVTSKLLRSGC